MKHLLFNAIVLTVLCLGTSFPSAVSAEQSLLIDAVVASVNSHPITLQDIQTRLSSPRTLSLKEASQDGESRGILDKLITEKLIEEEARLRRVSVSDTQIEEYIDEVAAQNGLSRDELVKTLKKENISLESYRQTVKTEILRSKLGATIVRDGIGVSEAKISEYLERNTHLEASGQKIKLRQILIEFGDDKASALQVIEELAEQIEQGASFEELARKNSVGPEAVEGGSLGIIALADLSAEMSDVLHGLEPGEISTPFESAVGYHIFRIDESFQEDGENDKLRSEIRTLIEQKKIEEKLGNFFTVELYKNHSVEKKI